MTQRLRRPVFDFKKMASSSSLARKRKIGLVCDELAAGAALEATSLPHPRGVDKVLFAASGRRLLELQRRTADYGSWFVDDGVLSETGVVLATPYDARFSVLALLTEAAETRTKFAPLDQVVADGAARHDCRDLLRLLDLDLGDLGAFCEKNDKHGDDLRLVRLDDAKCLAWLEAKADRVAHTLHAQTRRRPEVAKQAGAAAFVAASTEGAAGAADGDGPSRKARLRSVQAVAEYVADEWALKLAQAKGFPLAEVFPGLPKGDQQTAAHHDAENAVWHHEAEQQKLHELAFGTAAKRAKVDEANAKKTTTSELKNAKAAKGTKSIASFFGAKKKK